MALIKYPVLLEQPNLPLASGVVISTKPEVGESVAALLESSLHGAVSPITNFQATLEDGVSGCKESRYYLFSQLKSDAISESHFSAWEAFVSETGGSNDVRVFFEEDAFVYADEVTNGNFKTKEQTLWTLAKLFEAKKEADIMLLGHFSGKLTRFLMTIGGMSFQKCLNSSEPNVLHFPRIVTGSHAYAMTRAGAQKVLGLVGNTLFATSGKWETPDMFIQRHAAIGVLKVVAPKDRIVFQSSVARICDVDQAILNGAKITNANESVTACKFPRFLMSLIGRGNADTFLSNKYLLTYTIGNLFRIKQFAVTTFTVILMLTSLIYAISVWACLGSRQVGIPTFVVFASILAVLFLPDMFVNIEEAIFNIGCAMLPILVVAAATNSLHRARAARTKKPLV